MKYGAVIFDLFGTLVRNFTTREYQEVLAQMASALSLPPADFIKLWFETSFDRNTGGLKSIQANIKNIGSRFGSQPEDEQIERATRLRLDFIKGMLAPRPQAIEMLSYLKSKKYKIGLISDCSVDIPLVWDETPLASLFDVTIFSCSVGLKKPDIPIYELASKQLGVPPEECLFIGDGGSRELSGAAKAGMHPVLIRAYGSEAELPQSNSETKDWIGPVISSLKEVLTLVDPGH